MTPRQWLEACICQMKPAEGRLDRLVLRQQYHN